MRNKMANNRCSCGGLCEMLLFMIYLLRCYIHTISSYLMEGRKISLPCSPSSLSLSSFFSLTLPLHLCVFSSRTWNAPIDAEQSATLLPIPCSVPFMLYIPSYLVPCDNGKESVYIYQGLFTIRGAHKHRIPENAALFISMCFVLSVRFCCLGDDDFILFYVLLCVPAWWWLTAHSPFPDASRHGK